MRPLLLVLLTLAAFPASVWAADYYWVGGTATWDNTAGTKWATSSGGSGGAGPPTSSDNVVFDANSGTGTVTLAATAACTNATFTGFTGTLSHPASTTWTITGNLTFVSGMTYSTTSTSTTTFAPTPTSIAIAGGGKTFNAIVINHGSASVTIGNLTTSTLTATGGTSQLAGLLLSTNVTVTGTLTLDGNSQTNRLFVTTNTFASTRTFTITGASVSASNVDFRSIVFSVATDLSGITGGSGDCGNNSGITFTTPVTRYWIGDTGNWSASAEWSTSSGGAGGASVPICHDTALFDANSFSGTGFTVSADMPRLAKDINFTGVGSDNPTFNLTESGGAEIYGNLTLSSGMSVGGTGTPFRFRGGGAQTLTSAGVSINRNLTFQALGGSYTLQDDLTTPTGGLTIVNGTLNANNFDVTANTITSSGTAARTLTMGSGTWTATGTGSVWNFGTTGGLTFNANTSTLVIPSTSATAKTFTGGGLTYATVTFSGDNITVTGSNTFTTMNVNTAGLTNGLKLTNGTTQTVTTFASNGSSGSLAKLVSSTGGSAATLSKASGNVCEDYLSIQDSTATGGAGWYAGANSTNVSGNTGWTFTACPAPSTFDALLLSGD